MNSIKKKNIFFDLKKIIKENNFVDDIWVLSGNLSDTISDIDLIVVYKKVLPKNIFSKIYSKFNSRWISNLYK